MPHDARSRASQDVKKGTASDAQRVLLFADLVLYYFNAKGDLEQVFTLPPADLREMAYASACYGELEITQVLMDFLAARGTGKVGYEKLFEIADDFYDDLSGRIPEPDEFEAWADEWAEEHALPTKWG